MIETNALTASAQTYSTQLLVDSLRLIDQVQMTPELSTVHSTICTVLADRHAALDLAIDQWCEEEDDDMQTMARFIIEWFEAR
jgi:hypothetical protein